MCIVLIPVIIHKKLIRSFRMKNKVHEKGYKGKSLTTVQKQGAIKSKRLEQGLNIFLDLWSRA